MSVSKQDRRRHSPWTQAARWLLVLPAAAFAAVAVAFPIHWWVMAKFVGEEGFIQISSEETLRTIEGFLQGILGPLAFAYAGARVAPARQTAVCVALSLLVVLGGPLLLYQLSLRPELRLSFGILQWVSNVGGCLGSYFLIRHHAMSESPRSASEPSTA